MANQCTIGLDFGTLSARAMLVSVRDGSLLASYSFVYPHGVMETELPFGAPLPADFALQHPGDYLIALETAVRETLALSGCKPDEVIGLGADFTQCTMMPVCADGTPLCLLSEFQNEPYAYPKLWKHHAAQPEANRINALSSPEALASYGGKISSEWMLPKLLETYLHAPKVFAAADLFLELADFIPRYLTGSRVRSTSIASVAAMWNPKDGYPDRAFLESLAPGFAGAFHRVMKGKLQPIGSAQGYLLPEMAARLGLKAGIPVAVGAGDCHAAVCGAGIVSENRMLMMIGTSGCDLVADKQAYIAPGMCGICYESMLPGLYGYEAGQPCVGDLMQWFTARFVPGSYYAAAETAGLSIYDYLNSLLAGLRPGQSGMVALDWWNGNRSVFMDADLSGLLIGMTLSTKPEDIYQALMEGLAFGKRMILERLEAAGVEIREIVASGGIAEKNPCFMQILSDVLKKPIALNAVSNASCQGAAVLAAVAAGAEGGGYDSLMEAGAAMGGRSMGMVTPRSVPVYEELYAIFSELSARYAAGGVMHRLKALREQNGQI